MFDFQLMQRPNFEILIATLTGLFLAALLALDLTYPNQLIPQRPVYKSMHHLRLERRYQSQHRSISNIIQLIRHRYHTQGHCDIDTHAENLLNHSTSFKNWMPARDAVVIAGGVRTLIDSWTSQYRTLIRPNRADVYLYLKMPPRPSPADCFNLISVLSSGRVRGLVVHRMDIQSIIHSAVEVEQLSKGYPYWNVHGPDTPRESMLIQYWLIYKGWELYDRTRLPTHAYRVVVKLRPDIYFGNRQQWVDFGRLIDRRLEKQRDLDRSTQSIDPFIAINDCNHGGGLNDQYAIMDATTAALYMQIIKYWDHYTAQGIRWHQEIMIQHHILTANKVPFYPLERLYGFKEKWFDYCIRRPEECDLCRESYRRTDFPPEFKY